MSGALRRWWRQMWPSPEPSAPADPGGGRSSGGRSSGGRSSGGEEPGPGRAAAPRRHTAPPRDDDPQREAHLGAVLEALAGGALPRAELNRRVDGEAWGPGRFDAVVDHGVTAGVLRADASGAVRARYAD